MGVSTLFSRKPNVVVHDFTEFSINAKHFQLFEGKSKNLGCFADRQKIYADRRLRTTALIRRIRKLELLRCPSLVCWSQRYEGFISMCNVISQNI